MRKYQEPFPVSKQPPVHMPIAYGPLEAQTTRSRTGATRDLWSMDTDDGSQRKQCTDTKDDEGTGALVCVLCHQHQMVCAFLPYK